MPTLYLGDWFMENYQRLGVPAPMVAKAKEVMRRAQEHRPRIRPGRARRLRHRLGGLPTG